METPDPQSARAALLTHLETLLASGVTHVLRTESYLPPLPSVVAPPPSPPHPLGARGLPPAAGITASPSCPVSAPPPRPASHPGPGHPDAGELIGPGRLNDPPMPPATPTVLDALGSMADLRGFIGACTRCNLRAGRQRVVFGVGDPRAKIMFVGEGPGADEDEQGLPFVGRAGILLTRMIEAMGLKRDDVYIANIVKCRPPGNRNPEPDESAACLPFLARQIELVNPKILVTLGKVAAEALLMTAIPITKLRGRWHEYRGRPLMPTFHPAFLLRSPQMKKFAWADLRCVLERIGKLP